MDKYCALISVDLDIDPRDLVIVRESRINTKQRPRIMIDMEAILVFLHTRATNNGTVTTKKALQMWARAIYARLKATDIYDEKGNRIIGLKYLHEHQIATLMKEQEGSVVCPLCTLIIRQDDPKSMLKGEF